MQFQRHRLAALIILAVITVSAQKKLVDIAIVVDNSPLDGVIWNQNPDFTQLKANTIVAVIEGLQAEFDCRFAVFMLGKDGPTNPTTIMSFSESNMDHHEIGYKIKSPIQLEQKNYFYNYNDIIRVINNMRKNFVERNPGNREGVVDILIWAVNSASYNDGHISRTRMNELFKLADENIDVLIMFELMKINYRTYNERRVVFGMGVSVQKTPPDIHDFGDDLPTFPIILNAKDKVPKWIKALLDACNSASGQGQCYFDGPNNCLQKTSIEIPQRIVKYCTTSQMKRRCPQGLAECTRLCKEVNDRGDVKPCDAQCDQRGWIRYRTGRAKTDPLYQHCSWEEDKEACQGPPCPKPPTTTTTKKTTTTSKKTTTTTEKKTTTTTEKTTSTTTAKQTTTTTKEGTKTTSSPITRKPEPPTKGPRPGPGPTKAPKPGPDTETEEPPPTDSGDGPATGIPRKPKPEDSANSTSLISVGQIVMLVLGILGTLAAIILIVVLIVLAVRRKRRRRGRGHRSPPDRGRDSRYSMDRTGASHGTSHTRTSSIDQSRTDNRTKQTRGTDRTRDGHCGNRTCTIDSNRPTGRVGTKGRTSGKDGGKQRKSPNRTDDGHRRSSADRHGGWRR